MTNTAKERTKEITEFANKYGVVKAAEFFNMTIGTVERYQRKYLNEQCDEAKRTKRVLVFDIETAPMEAYVWSMWKNDISQEQLIQDWSILCWAAKWLDSDEIITSASWREGDDVRDDKACSLALASLLDEADIVVGHNADKFDIKRVNTRLLKHGIDEPSPFKSVDTLKIAKHRFAISSNRLDFIGDFLGVGRKVKHEGFSMWKSVLEGDSDAQERMLHYNVGDITLLEQVYLAIRPWDKRNPNINLEFSEPRCPCCGSERLKEIGDAFTNVSTFTAVKCKDCGKYSRYGSNKKTKEEMQRTLRNIV